MKPELTNAVSIDCEMVTGPNGKNSIAQVSLCNEFGQCLYNYFVKQPIVEDYRTHITGITPNHLRSGKLRHVVHREVADIIRGRLLVGHALDNDLRALGLGHPEWNKRDLAYYFQTERGFPSLKQLAHQHIGWTIQDGCHSAVEDARAAIYIYKQFEEEWEEETSTQYYSSDYEGSENDYYTSSSSY